MVANLETKTVAELRPPDGVAVPVHVSLSWHREDPLAMHLAFRTGRRGWVTWTCAVELIRDGIAGGAGDGDIRLDLDEADPAVVFVQLSSPSGLALFEFEVAALESFVDRVDAAFPPWHPLELSELDKLLLTGGECW